MKICDIIKLKQIQHVKNEKIILSQIQHPFIVQLWVLLQLQCWNLVRTGTPFAHWQVACKSHWVLSDGRGVHNTMPETNIILCSYFVDFGLTTMTHFSTCYLNLHVVASYFLTYATQVRFLYCSWLLFFVVYFFRNALRVFCKMHSRQTKSIFACFKYRKLCCYTTCNYWNFFTSWLHAFEKFRLHVLLALSRFVVFQLITFTATSCNFKCVGRSDTRFWKK